MTVVDVDVASWANRQVHVGERSGDKGVEVTSCLRKENGCV